MCKVSILVPVYNVEQYLPQCLDSLLAQTLQDLEILCINDGSTDGSLSILQSYAASDARIRLIDKENTGYGHSMNCGIEAAKGEYIGIVESDDFADANMFAKLHSTARRQDADVVKSNFHSHAETEGDLLVQAVPNVPEGCLLSVKERKALLQMASPSIWTGLYRRAFLLQKGIRFLETQGASYQDTGFFLKCILVAPRIAVLQEGFLHYRTDNANSSVQRKDKVFCLCGEFDSVWRFLKQDTPLCNTYAASVAEYQYMAYMWNFNRIAGAFQYAFLQRFSSEFQAHIQAGFIKLEEWKNQTYRHQMEAMRMDANLWMRQRLLDAQRGRVLWDGFQRFLSRHSDLYVFGGGNVARKVASALKRNQIPMAGFLVTDKKDTAAWHRKENVIQMDEADERVRHALILIAVKEDSLFPVYAYLARHRMEMENVFMMTMEWRACLRQAIGQRG